MSNPSKTQLHALQNFILDIDCLDELSKWYSNVNIFDILKISTNEIRHSNVLAWLLDANESHGLGDIFVRNLISQFVQRNNDLEQDKIFKLTTTDFYSYTVLREWKHFDLFLYSKAEKIAIIIENKVLSGETGNQLTTYKDYLDTNFTDYEKFFIFLTPDGTPPSEGNIDWKTLTYQNVVDALDTDLVRKNAVPKAIAIINDYLNTLRRNVVKDQELIEICDKIYKKHKDALDLIYQYKTDENRLILEYVRDMLVSKGSLIVDELENSTAVYFYTPELDKHLKFGNEKQGVMRNGRLYQYYIKVYNQRISAYLEIAGKKVPIEYQDILTAMMDNSPENGSSKKSLGEFTYKILISTYYPPKESTYHDVIENNRSIMQESGELKTEEEIKTMVNDFVNFLIEQQDILLDKLKQQNIIK